MIYILFISILLSIVVTSIIYRVIYYYVVNNYSYQKYTIAFDLDATLCESIRLNEWKDILKVKPNEKWVNILKDLYLDGHKIVIFSRRANLPRGEFLTKVWLDDNNIPYNQIILDKPHYDILIDDRAYSSLCSPDKRKIIKQVKKIQKYMINHTYNKGKNGCIK